MKITTKTRKSSVDEAAEAGAGVDRQPDLAAPAAVRLRDGTGLEVGGVAVISPYNMGFSVYLKARPKIRHAHFGTEQAALDWLTRKIQAGRIVAAA